jgi:predicted  nucleic acid-binding Zn-ribbon protein
MIERVTIALVVFLAAASVRAEEECPTDIPEDAAARRAQAKRWFAKGETEAKAGNDVDALKAYQCSMTFVAHGFTAFNIAQIAERTGDIELAIASYGRYLLLVPEAKDATQVNERMDELRERLAKMREAEKAEANKGSESSLDSLLNRPPVEPSPKPRPKHVTPRRAPDVSEKKPGSIWASQTTAWITLGSGSALLIGGVVSNVLARGQMDTCRSRYNKGDQAGAESACSNAKPLAYLSYGLIGVGAAALAAGMTLFIIQARNDNEVAANVLPEGGFALRWSGRF